jgi:hypothetical protein
MLSTLLIESNDTKCWANEYGEALGNAGDGLLKGYRHEKSDQKKAVNHSSDFRIPPVGVSQCSRSMQVAASRRRRANLTSFHST